MIVNKIIYNKKQINKQLIQNKQVVGHSQLHVAVSICRSKHGIKAQIVAAKNASEKVSVKNIVFKEVLLFDSIFIFKDFIVIFKYCHFFCLL